MLSRLTWRDREQAVEAGPEQEARRRFEVLVLPHMDAAYNLAMRLIRQPAAAEDVAHDALVAALRGIGAWRGGDARAWLLAIVRNRAFDWLRAAKRRAAIVKPADDPDTDDIEALADLDQENAEEGLMRLGEAAQVQRLLDGLPPRLREVLVLREMEELSYRQIAEITDSPIGSVMSRLSRARALAAAAWRTAEGHGA